MYLLSPKAFVMEPFVALPPCALPPDAEAREDPPEAAEPALMAPTEPPVEEDEVSPTVEEDAESEPDTEPDTAPAKAPEFEELEDELLLAFVTVGFTGAGV